MAVPWSVWELRILLRSSSSSPCGSSRTEPQVQIQCEVSTVRPETVPSHLESVPNLRTYRGSPVHTPCDTWTAENDLPPLPQRIPPSNMGDTCEPVDGESVAAWTAQMRSQRRSGTSKRDTSASSAPRASDPGVDIPWIDAWSEHVTVRPSMEF